MTGEGGGENVLARMEKRKVEGSKCSINLNLDQNTKNVNKKESENSTLSSVRIEEQEK